MTNENMELKVTIRFETKMKAWLLVTGGYYLALPGFVDILVVDRNVISILNLFQKHPNRSDMDDEKWWIENLNIPGQTLNPILYAMEGRWKVPPTLEQFSSELDAASAIIQQTLPEVKILRPPQDQVIRAFDLCVDIQPRTLKEIDFLVAVCPKLSSRTAQGKEHPIESFIIDQANKFNLSRQSLCVIAALSVLYERSDGNEPKIGRRVLKPNDRYSREDAYNALSDLHALEFLAMGLTLPLSGEKRTAGIITRDKYLVAFWVCMAFYDGQWDGATFTGFYKPSNELFPRLNEEEIFELFKRLEE